MSFIPRAFSITHINLTHRNWTALGYPDCPEELPIIDPRGRLTAVLDGWSLDGWLPDTQAWLVLARRPYNPEGISFVHQVNLPSDRRALIVDDTQRVEFSRPAARHHVTDYRRGDVHIHLEDLDNQTGGCCDVGMVTATALFPVAAGEATEITASIPHTDTPGLLAADARDAVQRGRCTLTCPEPRYEFLLPMATPP